MAASRHPVLGPSSGRHLNPYSGEATQLTQVAFETFCVHENVPLLECLFISKHNLLSTFFLYHRRVPSQGC